MRRPFNISLSLLPAGTRFNLKDPRVAVRLLLAVLLVANVAAALIVFKPWGGSAEDLARERTDLRHQLVSMQTQLARTRSLVSKAQTARVAGDNFLAEYTTDRRTTFSTLYAELDRVTRESGLVPRPASYELDQVEGSDSLFQLTISATFEGSYSSLMKFVNMLDRSPRFLIIESLTAAPQQSNRADYLGVNIKLDTFVREADIDIQRNAISQLGSSSWRTLQRAAAGFSPTFRFNLKGGLS
jgi:Tfp pilus assembly protein PilO